MAGAEEQVWGRGKRAGGGSRQRETPYGHENIYIECCKWCSFSHRLPLLFAAVLLSLRFCFHPLVPVLLSVPLCCSILLSPTNDASHPQTHQLTLFQSYRTSAAFLPSLSRIPAVSRASRTSPLARNPVSCRRISRSYLR